MRAAKEREREIGSGERGITLQEGSENIFGRRTKRVKGRLGGGERTRAAGESGK